VAPGDRRRPRLPFTAGKTLASSGDRHWEIDAAEKVLDRCGFLVGFYGKLRGTSSKIGPNRKVGTAAVTGRKQGGWIRALAASNNFVEYRSMRH